VSVNFSGAVLSFLYFMILEDGTDRSPQDVSSEFPLYSAYLRRVWISHDNLAMQALVSFHIVWLSPSYMNLR